MNKGLPLAEAQAKAAQLEAQIQALAPPLLPGCPQGP